MRDAGSPRQPSADRSGLCYKFLMPKIIERWLLFKYIDGELTPLSKPLKKKEQAEQARVHHCGVAFQNRRSSPMLTGARTRTTGTIGQ